MRRLLILCAIAAAACGDDAPPATPDAPDVPDGPIDEQLAALPGIVSVTELPTEHAGYRRFDLRITQPVEHDAPDGATFTQQLTLLHRDAAAPMVLLSTGYWNYYGDNLGELARLLHGNQLVVEHRYFGDSRPEGTDWTALTIENAAGDHHRIVQALEPIYGAAWVSTGASKGGMTSIYHRRFYPDDVDATVPYVAPISFGAPDYRYDAFVDAVGTASCRQALQDLQVELLSNRRAMLEQRAADQAAADGIAYTRVALAPAVEGAVSGIYWAFWQYYGVSWCDSVPAPTASDDTLWTFLEYVSAVSGSADDGLAQFDAYYFQAEHELGYPGTMDEWLDGLLQYGAEDFAGAYPPGVTIPPYRAEAMQDIDAWVQAEGERLLFVYGEYDPWTGGMFALGAAADSLRLVVPQATHGADLVALDTADRDAALARLAAWTGVEPDLSAIGRRAPPPPPPLPPAIVHAQRLTRSW